MKTVAHDGNKLLVTKLTVTIFVKDLKDNVDDVCVQLLAGAYLDSPMKLIWKNTKLVNKNERELALKVVQFRLSR